VQGLPEKAGNPAIAKISFAVDGRWDHASAT
jgi:hypothetical protein